MEKLFFKNCKSIMENSGGFCALENGQTTGYIFIPIAGPDAKTACSAEAAANYSLQDWRSLMSKGLQLQMLCPLDTG